MTFLELLSLLREDSKPPSHSISLSLSLVRKGDAAMKMDYPAGETGSFRSQLSRRTFTIMPINLTQKEFKCTRFDQVWLPDRCVHSACARTRAYANTHLHKTIHLIINQSLMAFPLNESGVFLPAAVYKVSKTRTGVLRK